MSRGLVSLCMRARFGNRMRKMIAMKLAECCDDDGTGVYIDAEAVADFAECETYHVMGVIKNFLDSGLLAFVDDPRRKDEICFSLSVLEMLADGEAKFVVRFVDGIQTWVIERNDAPGGAA